MEGLHPPTASHVCKSHTMLVHGLCNRCAVLSFYLALKTWAQGQLQLDLVTLPAPGGLLPVS